MKPELGFQVLSILSKNVKRGYLNAVLREIRNGSTPLTSIAGDNAPGSFVHGAKSKFQVLYPFSA
jgi:hypothetical protein